MNDAEPLDITERSHNHDSDWTFHFILNMSIPYTKMVGISSIIFITKKDANQRYLVGFDLRITKKRYPDSYWSAMEIAKRLTDLMSVLYGDYVSARWSATK